MAILGVLASIAKSLLFCLVRGGDTAIAFGLALFLITRVELVVKIFPVEDQLRRSEKYQATTE